MLILINPYACGGMALRKWERVQRRVIHALGIADVVTLGPSVDVARAVAQSIERGERQFVAAGGDGTVNLLLNAIMTHLPEKTHQSLQLGAIGLGSSNDFHKPARPTDDIDGIPCKIRFAGAVPRDIGILEYRSSGKQESVYFLSNASLGVTADANYFFNHPTPVLALLKRVNTPSAILYAAIATILRSQSFSATVSDETGMSTTTRLTNMAILKNPHVSGSLRYDDPIRYNDGAFAVHLFHNMTRSELLRLLLALSRHRLDGIVNHRRWTTSCLHVSTHEPIAVEYDGEVVTAEHASFRIIPQALQVCP